MWIVDITDETRGADLDGQSRRKLTSIEPGHQYGAHQPAEQVYDNKMFVTWFSGGLRVIDISTPYIPTEIVAMCRLPAADKRPSRATISSAPTMVCFI